MNASGNVIIKNPSTVITIADDDCKCRACFSHQCDPTACVRSAYIPGVSDSNGYYSVTISVSLKQASTHDDNKQNTGNKTNNNNNIIKLRPLLLISTATYKI